MRAARKQRLVVALFLVLGVGLAIGIATFAFKRNITLYLSPTEVALGKAPENRSFRIGGLVVNNSLVRIEDSLDLSFTLTDNAENINIEFSGILPDLFREGQGIIAMGKLNPQGIFVAEEVLAKHDEKYMPREVAESLKKTGVYQGSSE